MRRFALEFHVDAAREGQIRSVPGAALTLTVATLAVVHHHRFGRNFITDRTAGASAGISLAHAFSPMMKRVGPRTRLRSALVVLVMAAEPRPGLVAPLRRPVEPLVHAPEAVQSAHIGGIGVVDDAVLKHERA